MFVFISQRLQTNTPGKHISNAYIYIFEVSFGNCDSKEKTKTNMKHKINTQK